MASNHVGLARICLPVDDGDPPNVVTLPRRMLRCGSNHRASEPVILGAWRSAMSYEPNVSTVASLIGDPVRATMLAVLLDGRALPAGELAYAAGITAQTASSHLSKLLAGGLLAVEH